ncbi:alpha-ketoglutarate-dependent 2,4-dichlorophenoxyacetate dioxygenase [Podospora australis]|uniref:Alpha-ketoglutarate-dependent 2,4-dichlorophenoxyacetate dioxygenase n=1 Tax=Podospora australis TaxID=1536484 RepID=A0AAN6WQ35_9PEZI|nr:alpha-ketoglutarate-dependent 2,4-dichlorophenoxyacetate dioxygenase [Podospora australis]
MAAKLTQETPYKTITVTELRPDFGAEVSGVSFDNTSDEQLQELLAVLAKYGFCVMRSTTLTDETHVTFSRLFGDLDDTRRFQSHFGAKPRMPYFELFDAGNFDAAGNIVPADSPRAHANRGNTLFHADSSFNPRRSSFSLLRAVAIPPRETGGNTEFADNRRAFDELPEDTKEKLLKSELVGAHCLAQSRKLGSPEFFKGIYPSLAPMSKHKIVQTHEPSGRKTLYVGAHLHHIEGEGVDEKSSGELVEYLRRHIGQEKYVVSVAWENPGDLIIWDNRAVVHRAGRWEGEGKYARDLRRTTVHDDGSEAWGLNPVGTPMPTLESWQKRPTA